MFVSVRECNEPKTEWKIPAAYSKCFKYLSYFLSSKTLSFNLKGLHKKWRENKKHNNMNMYLCVCLKLSPSIHWQHKKWHNHFVFSILKYERKVCMNVCMNSCCRYYANVLWWNKDAARFNQKRKKYNTDCPVYKLGSIKGHCKKM